MALNKRYAALCVIKYYRIGMPVLIFRTTDIQPVNDLDTVVSHFVEIVIDVFLAQKFIEAIKCIIVAYQEYLFDIIGDGWPSIMAIGIILYCRLSGISRSVIMVVFLVESRNIQFIQFLQGQECSGHFYSGSRVEIPVGSTLK